MSPTPTARPGQLRARLDPTRERGEQGFVLLEELVAISLLVVVMAALATFFLTVVQSTTYERAKQSAVQLANSQMDTIRSIPPATLTAGLGPTNAAATNQYTAAQAIPAIAPYLSNASMTAASGAGTTQTVASQTTRTANNITYTVSDYLGVCSVVTTTGPGGGCTSAAIGTTGSVPYLRAVVAVTWPGSRCPVVAGAGLCTYVTSSLVSSTPDPQFVLADLAPAVPLVANPGPQITTVGANVLLKLALQPTTGVPTTTWAVTSGTLPAGLVMNPAGVISGTATTAAAAQTLTVTATDAFLRQATASFPWTVVAPPTITGLTTPLTVTAGATITPQPLTYTCPTALQANPGIGANCTETLTGAPSGIGIATTSTGPFLPSVTVSDTGGSGPLYLGGVVDSTTTGGTTTSTTYAGDVTAQGAGNYWPLDDTTAGTAVDAVAGSQNNPMVEQAGVTQIASGGSLGLSDRSATFNGTLKGWAAEQTRIAAPSTFSESIWFRTTSNSGGKLMGFGDSNTGPSVANDRQIYMDNTGVLRFGNWQSNVNASHVVTSAASYNDGTWHQAVGQMSAAGLSLYVDGSLVAADSSAISPYASNGYWRIGGDNLTNAWPGALSSTYFTGSLDDASIYPTVLTPVQIQQQYSDSGRTVGFSLAVTPAAGATITGTAVTGTPNTAIWTVNPPPTVTGLTTPFTTTAGATIANQTLPYTCPTGSCTFALAGAPTGIGLSTAQTGAGPYSATVTLTSGPTSGNLYLRGTVDPAAATSATYANDVTSQGATNYWHLNEASGTTGADAIGNTPLTESAGVGHGGPGAIFTAPGIASTFDGSPLGTARSQTQIPAPTTFSESIWFRTTTTLGGQLIGFGDSRTDARSGSHDRQLYMDTQGRVIFGVSATGGGTPVAVSSGTFNDGAWHQAVATMKSGTGGGQFLYVDGKLVGSQPTTSTVAYNGYWRIGGDDLSGWPAGPAGTFTGTLDEASVYLTTALTPAQVLQQYSEGVAASYTLTVTPTDTVTGFVGVPNKATWTVNAVPTVTGMVTPFATTAGATIATQPLPYTCPSTSCTEALAGAPAGIGLNLADTGSPQNAVSTIAANSGTVYLRGTVGPTAGTSNAYATDIQTAALGATNYWRLGESSGITGTDLIGGGSNLTYGSGVGHGAPGAIFTSPDTASTFDGAADGSGTASSQTKVAAPAQLSESLWFKTTTTSGGWLSGMTSVTLGVGNYDRVLYLDSSGHLAFMVNNGTLQRTTSSGTYNDGSWHQAVVTVSPTLGVSLYADGSLVSTNANYTSNTFSGYWRIGGGGRLVSDLPNIASNNFQGSIDDVSTFSKVLGAADVQQQYLDAKRVAYSLTATPTDATTSVTGPVNTATWIVRPVPAISGLVTPFSTTVGATITAQTLSYSCPSSSCIYTVNAPAGIGLSATPGGPATSPLSVSNGSGTIYLVGTVGPGTAGSSTVTVTPTDTVSGVTGTSAAAAWTIYPKPSISGLTTPLTVAAGATVAAQTLTYSCPTSSCTYSLTGAPPGNVGLSSSTAAGSGSASLSVSQTSGTIYLVGTVGPFASGSYALVVTPTDTVSGASGPPATAAWTVAVASVSGLITPFSTTVTATIASQPLAYSCPSIACSYTLAGAPTGIGLSLSNNGTPNASVPTGSGSGTIYLVGTVGGSPNTFTLTVTPRDTINNVSGTPAQAAWTVYAKPTITGLTNPFTTTAGATIANQSLPYSCPSGSCTFKIVGAPSGIGLSTTTGGTATGSVSITGSTSGNVYLRGTVAASAAPTSAAYANDVIAQGAGNYWRLGETGGSTGADSAGNLPLSELAGVGHGAGGAIPGNPDAASTFDGSAADGSASTQTPITGPSVFSESIWFKTTTTLGGRLLGFSNVVTGISNNYDRHIYMDNTGALRFGVCANGCPTVVTTAASYNDGQWHQAVGTLSAAGMAFYVDGLLIGTNPGVTTGQVFNGYWRLGGDNLNGWQAAPSSRYFAGTLDEASIYPTALTLSQVQQQWADAHASTYFVGVTPTDTATSVSGTANTATWTVNSPPAVTGLTNPFTTTAGATIATQTLPYSCPTGSCTFTATGLPANVGISTTSSGGTLGTTATVTASTGGVLYLRGTVAASVTPGSYAVAVTPTDTASGGAGTPSQSTWTVNPGPTVSSLPASASVYLGQQIPLNYITLSYTCPSLQCTFTVGGGLTGVGLGTNSTATPASSVSVTTASGSLYVSGTVSAVAGTYTVSVTPVDTASGASGTPTTSAVTNTGPTVAGQTAPLTTSVGATIANDAVNYTCPSSNCTFAVTGGLSGIGLYTSTTGATSGTPSVTVSGASGTLYLRGTIPASTATGPINVGISYTENTTAVSGPASSSTWTLKPAMTLTAPAALSVARGATASKSFSYTCQTTSCTVSASGMPPGTGLSTAASGGAVAASLTVNAGTATLYLQGTVTSSDSTGSYPITVTLTDPAGSTITATVTWTVT